RRGRSGRAPGRSSSGTSTGSRARHRAGIPRRRNTPASRPTAPPPPGSSPAASCRPRPSDPGTARRNPPAYRNSCNPPQIKVKDSLRILDRPQEVGIDRIVLALRPAPPPLLAGGLARQAADDPVVLQPIEGLDPGQVPDAKKT